MTDLTAAQWAAVVPEARFEESRHELDERVLAVAPDYADTVHRELNLLASALRTPVATPVGTSRWTRLLRRELMVFSTFVVSIGAVFTFDLALRDLELVLTHSLVGALMLVSTGCWVLWVWPVLRGRPVPERKDLFYAAGYQALITVAVAVRMLEAAGGDGMQLGWVVVCVLCAAVSVLVLFLLLRARTRPPRGPEDPETRRLRRRRQLESATLAGQDRLLDAFEHLPADDQAALQAEYTAAMAVLRDRGLDTTPAGEEPVPGSALLRRRADELTRLDGVG